MEGEFHVPFGKLPLKETVDFAKNLGFVYTFQGLAVALGTKHNGIDPPWTNHIVVAIIVLLGGVLTAMVIELYLRSIPGLRMRTRLLISMLFIIGGVLVTQLTRARLTEL